MVFQRFYCEPLAQAAYLIADGDEAVVVDPPRDVSEILAFAEQHGLKIRWALATHVHADFVAGLVELAAAVGARIGIGDRFTGPMRCDKLADGSEIEIGNAGLQVLFTPGHTPESVSFLLRPAAADQPKRLLSGDTLFLGDVGRPDLVAGADSGTSPRDMAQMMFSSLQERIAKLSDDTEVWPAHGAGSACGSNISGEMSSTIGSQRIGNWALNEPDRDRFCERLIGAQRPPPPYFAHAAAMNRNGPQLIADLKVPAELTLEAAQGLVSAGAELIDVRGRASYAAGHWPQAINLGAEGKDFETWAGTLVAPGHAIVLHAGSAEEAGAAFDRLLRIGYDNVVGFCSALPAETQAHEQTEAAELFTRLQQGAPLQVLDVRRPAEFESGHIDGAVHAELGPELATAPSLAALDREQPIVVICRSGYRSSAAIRQVRAAGFREPINVLDGMMAWDGNHLPKVAT